MATNPKLRPASPSLCHHWGSSCTVRIRHVFPGPPGGSWAQAVKGPLGKKVATSRPTKDLPGLGQESSLHDHHPEKDGFKEDD